MARETDNFFIRNATSVALCAITVLTALVGIIISRQDDVRNHTKELLVHTYEVTGHIQLLFNRIKDVELGQRGYIIAGSEEYLAPYQDALKNSLGEDARSDRLEQHHSLSEELTILRKLTQDNAVQQQNLDEMAEYITQLLKYWSAEIEERQKSSKKIAHSENNFQQANQMMGHVRRLVSIMMAEENHLLEVRTDANETSASQSKIATFTGLGIFYVLAVLSIWFYQRSRQRYMRELEQNEEQLKMQQEELEASNEEMKEKNIALEEQNAQIQQQSEELTESSRLIEEKMSELELASKYKSEFLANMSHELRTPLNSMLILTKLFAANEEGNLTEEQMEEARIIHNGGLELLTLINDILDLSKVEAGKLSFNYEDAYLEDIVGSVRQQFTPIAKQANIGFFVQVAENFSPILHTDAQRVEQILKNLLANAFKFTKKGSVTLDVYRPEKLNLQRNSLERENSIAFSVIDTGIGIDASKFKDIFEAFQQEDGSIDRHYGGTGLGLTIARKFAHMLGGEIHVTSEKGKGSTFTLILPMEASEEKAPESVAIQTKAIKAMSPKMVAEYIADDRKSIEAKDKVLLIIEDDKDFATVLMKIARKRGYKVLCAGDGKSGLLLAMEQRVTAIILDLKLPDMDGIQVLDQLKHNLRTRAIPVHIITGSDESESQVPLRKGAIGYLTKPIGKEAIDGVFTKIETLLQSDVKQVLIIEDDSKTQSAIKSLLKKKDTELVIVGTGNEASESIRQKRFDCIILDLHLPDISGFDWLKQMEKEMETLPPVIIYTAQDLTEEENNQLSLYTGSIIIKGAQSPERLLDEVTLFLHSVESTLSKDQKEMIRMQHNPNTLLQGRTVLLTDDDMRNTFALSKVLKSQGMNIIIAENGQAALERLKEHNGIELVIMDIMMPVMDGYQAMEAIRSQKIYRNLPIIALTARAMPEEQEKCMNAGANDYLTKPVDIDRLLTLLRVWLFKQEAA